MAARPFPHQPIPVRLLQRLQQAGARGKIDRPPVVGIDQREIPKLRALVEVRHARHGRLQRDLTERIQRAQQRQALRQRLQRAKKFAGQRGIENFGDEALDARLIRFVRVEPARLLLALARRLERVFLHPFRKRNIVRLPCAHQRLIQHVFERRRRRAEIAVCQHMRRVEQLPPRHGAGPFAGNFRQRHDPRAGILAALGVVGRGRRHAMRPLFGAGPHHPVKGLHGERLCRRIAADLVEREQAVVAVERRVLQRLCHHRSGELLHFQRKPAHARRAVGGASGIDQIQRQGVAQEVEDAVIGCKPVGARPFDRLRDQLAVMSGSRRMKSGRCDRPGSAARRVRAPAAGCRRNSRGWSSARWRCAPAGASAP